MKVRIAKIESLNKILIGGKDKVVEINLGGNDINDKVDGLKGQGFEYNKDSRSIEIPFLNEKDKPEVVYDSKQSVLVIGFPIKDKINAVNQNRYKEISELDKKAETYQAQVNAINDKYNAEIDVLITSF